MIKLSVIIPAYNEAERLPATLHDAYAWLQQHFVDDFEIIIADDGSSDTTRADVEHLFESMPHLRLLPFQPNQGKGAAVRCGMLAAQGQVQLFMDADHSTHIREVTKVFEAIENGADLVMASRQHQDSDISQHQSWLREHMGMGFNLLMKTCVQLEFKDTQCGFKAFTSDASKQLFSRAKLDGFSFDVELIFLAKNLDLNITEIPVQWINESNSKVRMLIDPLIMFRDIIRIRHLHRNTSFR